MKIIYLSVILMFLVLSGFSQSNTRSISDSEEATHQINRKFYIGLGGINTAFQDVKYSSVRYSGGGVGLRFGHQRSSSKSYRNIGMQASYGLTGATTNDDVTGSVFNVNIGFSYLRAIIPNLYIGGRWDVFDMYFRKMHDLGNNGQYIIPSSNLYAASLYRLSVSDNWKLDATLDLGLLSYNKESTGFTFSAPQEALENGEFSYQNEDIGDPLSPTYAKLQPIWNYVNIKTSIDFHYKKRITVGYHWYMRHFENFMNYPVTTASHTIHFTYNIYNKTKDWK